MPTGVVGELQRKASYRIRLGEQVGEADEELRRLVREWVKGTTQEYVAERLKVTQAYISQVCSGKRRLGRAVIARLAGLE